ncbi:MAG: sulfur-carrier protein [Mycobacterium sp.]|jgi:molybdopterin converting factor small subunit|nr:sulfur-carrier protein [Mycobacterium sp.]
MTVQLTKLSVTVRYFGAASAAVNSQAETLTLDPATTVGQLASRLGSENPRLAAVLVRCSYLVDGVAVRDTGMRLENKQTVDVLPPFAGG